MKLRVLLYCLLGGLPLLIAALGAGHFAWWWLSGVLLAAAFVPVALFGPKRMLAQFAVIAPVLLIVTVFCIWTETMIFVPSIRPLGVRYLTGSIMMYIIVAAVLMLLASVLKLNRPSDYVVRHRSVASATAMVLVSGFSYLLYYLIFGAITYQFFTKGYYPDVERQVAQLGLWFWAIQFGRGVLMTLAVLPVIYTLRMSRKHTAIVVGALIWIVGGLAPLIVPNELMVATQRMIHIVEILTQNALLGITAALLLRPKLTSANSQTASIATVIS